MVSIKNSYLLTSSYLQVTIRRAKPMYAIGILNIEREKERNAQSPAKEKNYFLLGTLGRGGSSCKMKWLWMHLKSGSIGPRSQEQDFLLGWLLENRWQEETGRRRGRRCSFQEELTETRKERQELWLWSLRSSWNTVCWQGNKRWRAEKVQVKLLEWL